MIFSLGDILLLSALIIFVESGLQAVTFWFSTRKCKEAVCIDSIDSGTMLFAV